MTLWLSGDDRVSRLAALWLKLRASGNLKLDLLQLSLRTPTSYITFDAKPLGDSSTAGILKAMVSLPWLKTWAFAA
jgi:hypothetical protein